MVQYISYYLAVLLSISFLKNVFNTIYIPHICFVLAIEPSLGKKAGG